MSSKEALIEQSRDFILKTRQGDDEAFAGFLALARPAILAYSRRLYGENFQDAEDLAAEAEEKIWRSLGNISLEKSRNPINWCLTITTNLWRDKMRRLKSQPQTIPLPIDREDTEGTREDQFFADPDSLPEDQAIREEEIERVRESLRRVSLPMREVLFLDFYLDKSRSEISDLTGSPDGTVSGRKKSGLAQLKALLAA